MFFVLHCGHLTAPSREAAGGFSCSCVVIISVVCATCALLAGCVMLANPGVMGSRVSACLCFLRIGTMFGSHRDRWFYAPLLAAVT